jgi:alpha-D-xyloside xylohydrolase
MLPKWAFGYAQSKERYVNAAEMVSVVREYRRRKIPLDLIVLDWKSWPAGSGWGQKSFDPVRFPDPETFTNELHKLGARLMISIWPIMTGDCPNQRELLEGGLMLGNQSTYDAFNEEARKVYWEQANRGLFSKGIDAWWCDCTEPFEADWSGAVKPEADARLAINTEQSKRYIDAGYINAYSLLHSKGIYEGQRRVTRDKRVINLTRSSYAGQHRYATITWSGDICATWETLRRSIPEGLNFCAAGEPYWTLDIGGFFIKNDPTLWFWHGDYDAGCRGLTGPDNTEPDPRDTGCTDPGFHELYTRWLQYAVFLPMFRSHGTDAAREIWRFGDEGNPFYDTIAKYIRLRYQLIPYIYSLAAQVTLNSYTLLRAVALDFSEDEATHNLTDQFLFGSAFMVCPVTNPMYYSRNSQPIGGDSTGEVASPSPVSRSEPLNSGAPPHPSLSLSGGEGGRRPGEGVVHGEGGRGLTTGSLLTRPVYLPKGSRWYDFWTEKVYEGGQTINAAAPLETIPLFVRAGAIVPMSPVMQYVDETPDAPYEIRIYDGADGEFFLYEDAGDNYDYEKGIYSLVKLSWNDRKGELVISERKGSFKGIVSERDFQIVLISEKGKEMKNVIYTGKETAVRGSRSG